MANEEMQKKKHKKTENSCLGCLKAPVLHLMCGYCLPTSNYLIQNQTFSMLQGHQDGKHLAVRVLLVFCLFVCLFFAEVELTSCACVTILLNSVATAFACKSARVLSDTRV